MTATAQPSLTPAFVALLLLACSSSSNGGSSAANGDGGGAAQGSGSCAFTSDTGAPRCIDYEKGFDKVGSQISNICQQGNSGTYSTSVCPTANRVGRCHESYTSGGIAYAQTVSCTTEKNLTGSPASSKDTASEGPNPWARPFFSGPS